MRGAEQAGFIGIVADKLEIDIDAVGLEQQAGAADGQLADAAGAEAAADDEAFRVAPILEPQEAADDQGELLGEVLDGALHDARGFGFALRQEVGELLLADLLAGFVAERILAQLLQRLAPFVENVPERVLAGLVADEAVLVLDFEL